VQTIVVHKRGCPNLKEYLDNTFHVEEKELEGLASTIFQVMTKHEIPFYQVVPHNTDCPGRHFPWEDLELKLFTLAH